MFHIATTRNPLCTNSPEHDLSKFNVLLTVHHAMILGKCPN